MTDATMIAEDPALVAAREWLAAQYYGACSPRWAEEAEAGFLDRDLPIRCGVAMWHAALAQKDTAR